MGWHCKNTGTYTTNSPVYNYPDADGLDNCDQIYYILRGKGWSTNAIVGLMTCIAFESGYNPWCWEGSGYSRFADQTDANNDQLGVPDADVSFYGYGLVQWTPASYENVKYYQMHGEKPNKYQENPYSIHVPGYGPNFNSQPGSAYDGYAQMIYLDSHGGDGQYYNLYHTYYSNLEPTYSGYKISQELATDLCETWTQNFERADGSLDPAKRVQRQALAAELWNRYNGMPVIAPDKPKTFPVWLLFYLRQMNFGKGWI